MATNVFGEPVTNDTVRIVYPNLTTPITARHRAEVAVLYMHQQKRMENLNTFVYNLANAHARSNAATIGMIYNATGNSLRFSMRHTWHGHVVQIFYPDLIQNGQWAGFLHIDQTHVTPSKEAIVYRGQDENGSERYWVLAWNTYFFGAPIPNLAYTTIESSQPRPGDSSYWKNIERLMGTVKLNFHSRILNGCYSSVTIGTGGKVEFVGIMTLPRILSIWTMRSADDSTIDSKNDEDDGGEGDSTPAADDDAIAIAAAIE